MSDLELKAASASSLLAPAELHGMVCGLAVTSAGGFSVDAFVELAGADALTDEGSVEQFVYAALDDLSNEEMAFAPIIPDDDEALDLRVGALGDFCAGFLSGFGAGVQAERTDLPPDVQEIISDFASISGIDDAAAEDEQDETSFMELFEYVRVGVLLIMSLMARPMDADA